MASPSELQAFEDINCTLLTTGMFSDVTLVVGEKTAVAHKGILAARSPVFTALFAELSNAENRVEIDVQADVLDHFIAFIYTGKVPALEPKMARDLLAAAEKYHLEQLKSIAENYLCGQSAPILLPFTEAVNATNLRNNCLEFTNRFTSPPFTPRPLPPIARLHDPCLVALFRQLPPDDQLTARTVCRRWADLVPYAARSTRSLAILVNRSHYFAEKQLNRLLHGHHWRLLKLLRKEDGTPLLPMHSLSQWNSLELSTLDEATANQIMATFPVLKELQLSAQIHNEDICESEDQPCDCCTTTITPLSFLDHLVHLLEHWRPQLTTLKLGIHSDNEAVSSCSRLGAAISSLPALKHLYLDLHWNGEPHCLILSNLHQLSHFTAYSNPNQYPRMLHQYGSMNSAPVQICYVNGDDPRYEDPNDDIIPRLASLNADLRRRFLRIDNRYFSEYRIVCPYFPSLTIVFLDHSEDTTFRDLLTGASQLTALIYLGLHIDFSTIRPDDQPHHLLPQLKSVKLLQLEISNQQSHRDLEPLNLPWTIPNMQVFKLLIDLHKCTTCGIINRSAPIEERNHCLHQMLAPLARGCAQLHTIKHKFGERLDTVEEMLAEEPPITEAASPSPIDIEPMDVSADNSTDESH